MKIQLIIIFICVLCQMFLANGETAENDEKKESFSMCCSPLVKVVVAGAVGATAVAAAPVILTAAGFGSAGVVAGSAAAAIQSSIGSVAAGSIFATLQSVGAGGLGAAASSVIGGISGLLGTSICNCEDTKVA